MSAPLLDLHDLRVEFPVRKDWRGRVQASVHAVDGVSLQIAEGETLALVGESGCGKSTTGNAILGLTEASGGEVNFDGEDLLSLSPARARALRRQMQVIFQDPAAALNPKLTIAASIAEPMIIAGTPEAERRRRVGELLDVVGLAPDLARRHPNALSGGQRQRVVIARALALSPRLVICDEPVSALDVSIRSQILNLLMRLQAELGLAYLFIAHDLSVVRHIADRVAVMYLGTIVEEGGAEEVFSRPRHPYTEALLAAIPLPDPVRQHAKPPFQLTGDLPGLADPPRGCAFATRCPIAEPRCRETRPALTPTVPGSRVACHLRAD